MDLVSRLLGIFGMCPHPILASLALLKLPISQDVEIAAPKASRGIVATKARFPPNLAVVPASLALCGCETK